MSQHYSGTSIPRLLRQWRASFLLPVLSVMAAPSSVLDHPGKSGTGVHIGCSGLDNSYSLLSQGPGTLFSRGAVECAGAGWGTLRLRGGVKKAGAEVNFSPGSMKTPEQKRSRRQRGDSPEIKNPSPSMLSARKKRKSPAEAAERLQPQRISLPHNQKTLPLPGSVYDRIMTSLDKGRKASVKAGKTGRHHIVMNDGKPFTTEGRKVIRKDDDFSEDKDSDLVSLDEDGAAATRGRDGKKRAAEAPAMSSGSDIAKSPKVAKPASPKAAAAPKGQAPVTPKGKQAPGKNAPKAAAAGTASDPSPQKQKPTPPKPTPPKTTLQEKLSPQKATPQKVTPQETPQKVTPQETPQKVTPQETPKKVAPQETPKKVTPQKPAQTATPQKTPERSAVEKPSAAGTSGKKMSAARGLG
eukprot:1816719-Rhodomonas_salina.1